MQICVCDICKEPIKHKDRKCLIAINVAPEENKAIKEEEYKEMLMSVFCEMQNPNRAIPLYEICGKCLEVFYHFINIRKDELEKTRKELKKMLSKKNKETKETV